MLKKIVRPKRNKRMVRHAVSDDTLFNDDEREIMIGGPADDPKEK